MNSTFYKSNVNSFFVLLHDMRSLAFILIFLSNSLLIQAQYEWTTYLNEGDLADAVRCIKIIDQNNIWVGTLNNGLQFFDGQNYIVYNNNNSPIPGNRVYDLILDSDGRIWIATNEGLAVKDNENWTIYSSENSNLPGNAVISLLQEEQGRIWFGTDAGVINGLYGTVYTSENSGLPGNQILDILMDHNGLIWFGTDKGIACFDGNSWKTFKTGYGVLPAGAATELEQEPSGRIWGAINQGIGGKLVLFDGKKWNPFNEADHLFNGASITAIQKAKNGTIWFGTHHKGLIKYENNVWEQYLTQNSDIPINQIISLAHDYDNNIWMGSRKGLTKIVSSPTSKRTLSKESQSIQIIPNPFKDYTHITVPEQLERPYSFTLYDLQGKKVQVINDIQANSFRLQNDGLAPGLYFYKILSGSSQLSGKLLIQD